MCNVRPEDSGEIKFVARNAETVAYLEVEGNIIVHLITCVKAKGETL